MAGERPQPPGMNAIVELRQYTLRPGSRDTLADLFEREFVAGQEAAGITVGGRFRDLDDEDRFVWLRSFPDMTARARAMQAFYYGPVWQAHREAANATMLDSDDVLLRGPGFAAPDGTGPVGVTICHPLYPGFTDHLEHQLQPALAAAGTPVHAAYRSEHAENTFPALPVRTGEDVVLWFTTGEAPRLPDLSSHPEVGSAAAPAEAGREASGPGVCPAKRVNRAGVRRDRSSSPGRPVPPRARSHGPPSEPCQGGPRLVACGPPRARDLQLPVEGHCHADRFAAPADAMVASVSVAGTLIRTGSVPMVWWRAAQFCRAARQA
jgi:hypothetical protein